MVTQWHVYILNKGKLGSRILLLRLIFYIILSRILFKIVPGLDVKYEDSKQSTDGEENNDEDEDHRLKNEFPFSGSSFELGPGLGSVIANTL